MARQRKQPIAIRRVSTVHFKGAFQLKDYVRRRETIEVGGNPVDVQYLLGFLPLDCIDDITRAGTYNPRHPREDHRNLLMYQVGTYGLIQPLVCTLEPDGGTPKKVYLIDGRHRYRGLIELDPKLKESLARLAQSAIRKNETTSVADVTRLSTPRGRAMTAMKSYKPPQEETKIKKGSPLVPVKIYLNQAEVERIGMAVFLNKGQKKLAGGEQLEKVYRALETAISELRDPKTGESNEATAVERVMKGQTTGDSSVVVLSQHVAKIMNDDESPWFEIIGRWQGELVEEDPALRKKPLTANNFLAFVKELIDDSPKPIFNEKQRDLEVHHINRVGEYFATHFKWPQDIPTKREPYTATALLCRSFLVQTVGIVLNEQFKETGSRFLSRPGIPDETWAELSAAILRLYEALEKQATTRRRFERLKKSLKPDKPKPGPERVKLLADIDSLRGELWSLDTIIPSLKARLEPFLRREIQTEAA